MIDEENDTEEKEEKEETALTVVEDNDTSLE